MSRTGRNVNRALQFISQTYKLKALESSNQQTPPRARTRHADAYVIGSRRHQCGRTRSDSGDGDCEPSASRGVLRSIVQASFLDVLSPFGVRSLVVQILVVLLEHLPKRVTGALFRLQMQTARVSSGTDHAVPALPVAVRVTGVRATAHLNFLQRLPKLPHLRC